MLLVGLVRRTHGLEGEVSVEPVTAFPRRFTPGLRLEWRRAHARRELTVRSARSHGERLLLSFEGIGNVDAARELSGGDLCVPDAEAVAPREGYYLSHQVEGWRCEDPQGRFAGTVKLLETTAAGAMLSIELASGREALIPFVHPIVLEVDEEGRRIVIDPPAGLLEL